MRDRVRQFEYIQYIGTVDEVLKQIKKTWSVSQTTLLANTQSVVDNMDPSRPLPPSSFDTSLIGTNMFKQILLVSSSTSKVIINGEAINFAVKGLEDFQVNLYLDFKNDPSKGYYDVVFDDKYIATGYADVGYI